jgi:hypothetical protein
MRVTWYDLDKAANASDHSVIPSIPNYPDYIPSDILQDCLGRVSEADINIFMKEKPELSKEDIIEKLPGWLRDQYKAFLPQLANEMPPRCAWDHKIELLPGKESPSFKNRPLSPSELCVVRKWLDENLSKGFI